MADNTIEIEVIIDGKSFDGSLKKIEKGSEKAGKKSGKEFGEGFEDTAERGLKGVGTAIAAVGAALAGVFASREIINAAAAQEDAFNSLSTSLARIGENSKETFNDLVNFSTELQATTRFGDEAIQQQLAFAQSLGATADQSKVVVQAAADLAESLNIDLNSATRNVAKTLGGYAGELGEVIPELKNFTTEQLQAGEGVRLLAQQFAGVASARVQTFSGSLAQLRNTFGDLLESIGFIVTKSPALIRAFQFISEQIRSATSSISEFGKQGDVFQPILIGAVNFGKAISDFVIKPIELIVNVAELSFNGLRLLINELAGLFIDLVTPIATVGESFGILPKGAEQALNDVRSIIDQTSSEFSAAATQSGEDLFKGDISAQADQFLSGLSEVVEASAPLRSELQNTFLAGGSPEGQEAITASNQAFGESFGSFVDSFAEQAKKIKITNGQIAQSFTQTFARGVGNAFGAFGAALANGGNAFKAFTQVIQGLAGDLALQLGQNFILQGTARALAGDPGGGALIAAGAALATFGGFLKAKSGGGGGGGGGVPSVGGGGIATNPQDAAVVSDVGDPQTGPSNNVQLVVQGDILDSDETGSRLLNLLNDNFDNEGGTVSNNARFAT